MLPRHLGGLVFGAALLGAMSGHAQEAPAPTLTKPWGPRLEYHTAPGCPDEETFRHTVAIFFEGVDPFDVDAAEVVRVTLQKIPGGYRGTVQKIPAKGDPWPEEESSGRTCVEVFHDAARVASMRVPDPPKVDAPPPPVAPPPPPPDPVPSPLPPVAATSEPLAPRHEKKPPSMDLAISLSAAVLMSAGFTADVGPGVQISGGVRRDWFSLDLELRGVFPSKVYAREPVDPKQPTYAREFDISQLTAGLVPCVHFATYFAGCGVAQAGMIVVQTPVETRLLASVSFGPRLWLEYPFADKFAVFAFGEGLFPVAPAGFGFRTGGPNGEPSPNVIWSPSVVSGFFGGGLSLRFK